MRAIRSTTAGVALLLLGTIAPARAQTPVRQAGLDLGIYAGGAWSSDWYEARMASSTSGVVTSTGDETGYGLGITSSFGAMATYWLHPSLGVRLHGAYLPSPLPRAEGDEGNGNPVNNYLYDLDVLYRPWAGRPGAPGPLASLYAFAGGGGLTVNIAGGDGASRCEPASLSRGACLTRQPGAASVGQGVLGIGAELLALGSGLGAFAEIAAHGYESPAHTGDGFIPATTVRPGAAFAISDDAFAVTTRLVVGVKWSSTTQP